MGTALVSLSPLGHELIQHYLYFPDLQVQTILSALDIIKHFLLQYWVLEVYESMPQSVLLDWTNTRFILVPDQC